MSHDFSVGDIVKLRHASAPQRVTKVYSHVICTKYLNTHHTYWKRAAAHFERVHSEEIKVKLFKTKDDQYGTLLTKDSKGHFVLELKGLGQVQSYDPKTLEEVLPYTVEIQWSSGHTKHYEVPENSVSEGDIIIGEGLSLGRVQKINTKNRSPKTGVDFRKVGTTPIK